MQNKLQSCTSRVSCVYSKYLDVASCSKDSDDDETRRYKRNWIIIHAASLLMGTTYTITLSSQYQFVTNPRHPEDPNEQAGLGESDVFYSLTIAIFSIGELFASLIFSGLSSWHIKLKYLMLLGLILLVVGGLFYGVAYFGWMVLVGRFLQGIHLGGQSTLLRIYIGETTNTVRDIVGEDPEKSQLKNVTFLLNFMLGTLGIAFGPGIAALVAQIPLVDDFRWSGWFYVFYGTMQMLITVVMFKEKWTDLKRTSIQCRRLSILSGIAVPFYCLVFMIVAFFIINCALAIIETLQNPILSDNFGIDVKWSSYIFLISLSFFPLSAVTIFLLQRRGLDNRFIFLLGMSLTLTTCMLITDWQAIGGDPCDKFSGPCNNRTNLDFNSSIETILESDNASCEACRMHSGEPYHCFWNPDARISHEFCSDCEPFCRSELHTVNFIQFLIGVCLFSFSFPMMRITSTVIVSDCLGSASQSLVMGILVSSGALSRCTAPLWGDAAYVAANHRTYLPILLLAGLISTVVVIYLILFRKLKPYHSIKKGHKTANGAVSNGDVSNGDVVELVEAEQDVSQEVVESEVTSL